MQTSAPVRARPAAAVPVARRPRARASSRLTGRADDAAPAADVRLHDKASHLLLRAARAPECTAQRAGPGREPRAFEAAALADDPDQPNARVEEQTGGSAVVFVGQTPVVALGDDDAAAAGGDVTLHVYAAGRRLEDRRHAPRGAETKRHRDDRLLLLAPGLLGPPRLPAVPPRGRSLRPRADVGEGASRSHPGPEARTHRGGAPGGRPRRAVDRARARPPPRSVRHRLLVAHLRPVAFRRDAALHGPTRRLRPRAALRAHRAGRLRAPAARRDGGGRRGARRGREVRGPLLRRRRARGDPRVVAPPRPRGSDERPRASRDGDGRPRARRPASDGHR